MKVPADQIVIPLVPRRPRNGIRSYHTDHPVWPQPVHDVTNWGTFAIDNNGQIHDLAGWGELTGPGGRWAIGGAAAGFVLGKGFSGILLGALAGYFAGPTIANMFRKLRTVKQVVDVVPGSK